MDGPQKIEYEKVRDHFVTIRSKTKPPTITVEGLFLTGIRRFRAYICLAGVRGSRTHLPRSSRGITDLKSAL